MKKIFTLFIFLAVCLSVCAQPPVPVKWRASAKMVSATEGVVTLKATVQKGWHLYGMDIPSGGPKATAIEFDKTTGIEFTGNITPSVKPVEVHDPQFGIDVTWWESSVTFTRTFRKTGDVSSVSGSITYMGCNDQTCTPPRTEKFNARIIPYKETVSK